MRDVLVAFILQFLLKHGAFSQALYRLVRIVRLTNADLRPPIDVRPPDRVSDDQLRLEAGRLVGLRARLRYIPQVETLNIATMIGGVEGKSIDRPRRQPST